MKTLTRRPATTFNCLTKPLPVRPLLGSGHIRFTRSISNKYGPWRRQRTIPYLALIFTTSQHSIDIHYRMIRNMMASKITPFVIRPHLNIAMASLLPRHRIDDRHRNVLTNQTWDNPRSDAVSATSPVATVQPRLASALLMTDPASLTMPRPGTAFVHRSWQDYASRLHRLFAPLPQTSDRAFPMQQLTTAIAQSIVAKSLVSRTIPSANTTLTQWAPDVIGFGNIDSRTSIRPHRPQSEQMGPVASSTLILPGYDGGLAQAPIQLKQHNARQAPAPVFLTANIINRLAQPVFRTVTRNLDRVLTLNQRAYYLSPSSRQQGSSLNQFPTRIEMQSFHAEPHLTNATVDIGNHYPNYVNTLAHNKARHTTAPAALRGAAPTAKGIASTLRTPPYSNRRPRTFLFPTPHATHSPQPHHQLGGENNMDIRVRQFLDIISSTESSSVFHKKPSVWERRQPPSTNHVMTRTIWLPQQRNAGVPQPHGQASRLNRSLAAEQLRRPNGHQQRIHIGSAIHFSIRPSQQQYAGVPQPHDQVSRLNRSLAADQLRDTRLHDELVLVASKATPSGRHLSSAYQAPPVMQLATSQAQTAQDVTQAFKDLAKRLAESVPKESPAPAPELDINQLTGQVYQEIERKLRIERERRGL